MDFIPLRIATVKPLKQLTFDLYIYFKEHYLCYSKKNELLTVAKYEKLKTQKIAKFFITVNDEKNYQTFLDSLLTDVLESKETNLDDKIEMVDGVVSSAIDRMQQNPNSESAFKMTETAAKNLRQIITKNPEALRKIFGKKIDKNDFIIKHSLNVCALSTKLSDVLKCTDQEIEDLGTAALIHDIGLTLLSKKDIELFNKPKKMLTSDDKRIYANHVKDVKKLLENKPYVNTHIIELVLNHEEVLTGSGPNKKKKLSKTEEILSLVNNYDKRTLINKNSPTQAIKDIMINEIGNYSLEILNEFKKLLHDENLLDLE